MKKKTRAIIITSSSLALALALALLCAFPLRAQTMSFLSVFDFSNGAQQPNCIPETRSYKGEVTDKYGVWPTEAFEQGKKPWWIAPKLLRLRTEIRKDDDLLDSFLILYKGKLVYEEYYNGAYDGNTPHEVHSVTKGIVSALVGIAIGEGFLGGVGDKVLDYFPEAVGMPGWEESKRDMTIEHLLTMTSGIWDYCEDEEAQDAALRSFLLPQACAPGTQWKYGGSGPDILVGIIERATGQSLLTFAHEKLFDPLGIASVEWETWPSGAPIGGWGIWITPRDMARFGYLYLNYGRWEDRQIIPADYVLRSKSRSMAPQGYGYLLTNNKAWPFTGSYESGGAASQSITIWPHKNMVLVFTGSGIDELGIEEPVSTWQVIKEIYGK